MTDQEIRNALDEVSFQNYTFNLGFSGNRTWLQATFMAPDCHTGADALQYTRKWYISNEATKSEIVQTAFKLALTSVEHEAREAFTYRGQRIFGPHMSVDVLAKLCEHGAIMDKRVTA